MKKLLLSLLAFLVMSPCFAATLVVTSGGNAEGGLGYNQASVSWSAARTNAVAGYAQTNQIFANINASSVSGEWVTFGRGVALFDTSGLTADAVISAATFSLLAYGGVNDFAATPAVDIVSSNPASDSSIAVGDYLYTRFGTTVFSSISLSSINFTGTNNFTINGDPDPNPTLGLAYISKTGLTKLGTRISWDTSNSEPTWGNNDAAYVNFRSSEYTGTVNDPTLTITYTLPTAPVFAASPTVDTITTETATGHANITSDGGDTITERGWVLDTSTAPVTTDTKFTTAGTTGSYNTNFTSLSAGTHYYARPHAINGIGTTYGDEVEFDTLSASGGAFFQFFD